jgi:hypothetical protein
MRSSSSRARREFSGVGSRRRPPSPPAHGVGRGIPPQLRRDRPDRRRPLRRLGLLASVIVTRYDTCMARPRTGKALSDAERMRRYRARRRATGLRAVTRWVPCQSRWSDHRIAEARSLAMHVLAARRIDADRTLLARARAALDRWLASRPDRVPAALDEWRTLLARPWPEIAARATALDEEGARLRQSSPLVTVLSAADRRRIHDAFRA